MPAEAGIDADAITTKHGPDLGVLEIRGGLLAGPQHRVDPPR